MLEFWLFYEYFYYSYLAVSFHHLSVCCSFISFTRTTYSWHLTVVYGFVESGWSWFYVVAFATSSFRLIYFRMRLIAIARIVGAAIVFGSNCESNGNSNVNMFGYRRLKINSQNQFHEDVIQSPQITPPKIHFLLGSLSLDKSSPLEYTTHGKLNSRTSNPWTTKIMSQYARKISQFPCA